MPSLVTSFRVIILFISLQQHYHFYFYEQATNPAITKAEVQAITASSFLTQKSRQ